MGRRRAALSTSLLPICHSCVPELGSPRMDFTSSHRYCHSSVFPNSYVPMRFLYEMALQSHPIVLPFHTISASFFTLQWESRSGGGLMYCRILLSTRSLVTCSIHESLRIHTHIHKSWKLSFGSTVGEQDTLMKAKKLLPPTKTELQPCHNTCYTLRKESSEGCNENKLTYKKWELFINVGLTKHPLWVMHS